MFFQHVFCECAWVLYLVTVRFSSPFRVTAPARVLFIGGWGVGQGLCHPSPVKHGHVAACLWFLHIYITLHKGEKKKHQCHRWHIHEPLNGSPDLDFPSHGLLHGWPRGFSIWPGKTKVGLLHHLNWLNWLIQFMEFMGTWWEIIGFFNGVPARCPQFAGKNCAITRVKSCWIPTSFGETSRWRQEFTLSRALDQPWRHLTGLDTRKWVETLAFNHQLWG